MKLHLSLVSTFFALSACTVDLERKTAPNSHAEVRTEALLNTPDWAKDAVIYQINTRQYSVAGTFEAVKADLDRIEALGVDILWFMPIHPIGKEKRKGTMGSPYAVKDFRAVNPELGTLEDFKSLVEAAQARGMKVIIDWVANHTAWDNYLIKDYPEWYTRNDAGQMQHPEDTDWLDVADLDYSQQGLRDYMKESLVYWVEEVGIDGYRCDVAGMVPTDFWEDVRPALDSVKPVFMLAEWQDPELHEKAFDASYAWRWKEILQDIVVGQANAGDMRGYYSDYQQQWPKAAMRMAYTSNHDQNTWDGLPQDIYGDAYELAMVLSFVGEGIPLIYNGQECANRKRLEFFEKDLIEWHCDNSIGESFKSLVRLKTENTVLHNGLWGSSITNIPNTNSDNILSFKRTDGTNTVLFIGNLSNETQSYRLMDETMMGNYVDFLTQDMKLISESDNSLPAWGWSVYVRN